jgi:hypothetical protein
MPASALVRCLADTAIRSDVMGELFRNIFKFHDLALTYFMKPCKRQICFRFSSTHEVELTKAQLGNYSDILPGTDCRSSLLSVSTSSVG